MITVKEVLKDKGSSDVVTIRDDKSVCEAMSVLVDKNIGSMLVLNKENVIVGIVSERDCLRTAARTCKEIDRLRVDEIMTRDIIICQPEDDLQTIENLMTQNKIRHLPVIDKGKLVGLISIGDVVKMQTEEIHVENRYLRDYIMGRYPR